jgi:hypothetical protein
MTMNRLDVYLHPHYRVEIVKRLNKMVSKRYLKGSKLQLHGGRLPSGDKPNKGPEET